MTSKYFPRLRAASLFGLHGAVLWSAAAVMLSGCGRESVPPQGDQDPAAVPAATAADALDGEVTVADPPLAAATPAPPPEKLGIGDPHPGLMVAKWIKGDPVEPPLTGKVHVVEFWATWCGPCLAGMPHITELQSRYGDEVTFIGVTREDEATVDEFLASAGPDGQNWDEIIGYRLALDDDSWTNAAYMRAAGQNGIPCAFIVGPEGVVEWIGHPARIDQPLQDILDGNWDRQAAIAEFEKMQQMRTLSRQLVALTRERDWNGALEQIDQFEADHGPSLQLRQTRLQLLQNADRDEEASQVAEQLIDDSWDNARLLNAVAWSIATRGSDSLLELATKAAERGSELTDHQDASILDTVARCYYEQGQLDEAIEWQQRAVEHAEGQAEMEATLAQYRKEQTAAEKVAGAEKSAGEPAGAEDADDASDTEQKAPAAEQPPAAETPEAQESDGQGSDEQGSGE